MHLAETLLRSLWIVFSNSWPLLLLMAGLGVVRRIMARVNRMKR